METDKWREWRLVMLHVFVLSSSSRCALSRFLRCSTAFHVLGSSILYRKYVYYNVNIWKRNCYIDVELRMSDWNILHNILWSCFYTSDHLIIWSVAFVPSYRSTRCPVRSKIIFLFDAEVFLTRLDSIIIYNYACKVVRVKWDNFFDLTTDETR